MKYIVAILELSSIIHVCKTVNKAPRNVMHCDIMVSAHCDGIIREAIKSSMAF